MLSNCLPKKFTWRLGPLDIWLRRNTKKPNQISSKPRHSTSTMMPTKITIISTNSCSKLS